MHVLVTKQKIFLVDIDTVYYGGCLTIRMNEFNEEWIDL
jgi:hypothetical protein